MLTDVQKRYRLDISRFLLSRYEDDPGDLIDRVVTQDQTWVHHFDQSKKCKACNGSTLAHPLPRSFREFLRKGSDGLSLLDSQGVNMVDYLE